MRDRKRMSSGWRLSIKSTRADRMKEWLSNCKLPAKKTAMLPVGPGPDGD